MKDKNNSMFRKPTIKTKKLIEKIQIGGQKINTDSAQSLHIIRAVVCYSRGDKALFSSLKET